jgi:hypothetical protein
MLIPMTDKVLAAFAALEHDTDFQIVVQEYLAPSLKELDKQLRTLDGTRLHQAQGAAQALEKLIENTEKARTWLKQRRDQK